MRKSIRMFSILFLLVFINLSAQTDQRREIKIPDIAGYKTLKCDFHIHTVFSDGDVWPTLRVEEAWSEGLDAIAITDHIEYQPKKADVNVNHNRSYEIAKTVGDRLGIVVIRGGEITRDMPPGHMNLIFLNDTEALVKQEWKESVLEGKKQGALLFWNHPGWTAQQPDGIPRWYPDQDFLIEQGMLMGIEAVNETNYYPLVHTWCNEKKLTLMGNTDIHSPIAFDYDLKAGALRTMTLVFAKENTPDAIKDALVNRRTAVLYSNRLLGEEKYLVPIFEKSVRFLSNVVKTTGRGTCYLQVRNDSDIPYTLQLKSQNDKIGFPKNIVIPANRTVQYTVRANKDDVSLAEKVKVEYEVKNLLTAPDKGIMVNFEFDINVTPKKK